MLVGSLVNRRLDRLRFAAPAFLLLAVALHAQERTPAAVPESNARTTGEVVLTSGETYREYPAYRDMIVLEDPSTNLAFVDARRVLDAGAAWRHQKKPSLLSADQITGFTVPANGRDWMLSSDFVRPPAFGNSESAFWVRIVLRNQSSEPVWFLAIERARLDFVDLYQTDARGAVHVQHAGSRVYPAEQPHTYRYPVFALSPAADETSVYYLRVQSSFALVTLPLVVRTAEQERLREIRETALLGVYFGIVGVMVLYNCVLFLSLRIRAYLYYVLYLLSFSVSILIYQGVLPFLLSPAAFAMLSPYEGRLLIFAVHITCVSGVFFVHAFLSPDRSDWLDNIGRYVGFVLIAVLLIHAYAPVLLVVYRPLFGVFFVGLPLLGLVSGVIQTVRKKPVGAYFLIAWSVLLLSVTGLFLEHQGVLPYGFFGRHGILAASGVEMTLLSIGLGDHFRRIGVESERVHAASRAKTAFLANMSHEIRTPLNAILGMGELLAEAELKPTERGYVEILQRAGQGLLSLVNDILDLSKIEAGKLQLEQTPFDLYEVVQHTTDIIASAARERGFKFGHSVDPAVVARRIGDPLRLRQVLLNLMSNAVKFTEEGEVWIEVRPGARADHVRFDVCDTGIGIDEEKWRTIFDSFVQADESTTRRHGGTGLGLAISRSLVELMGGKIEVTSMPGKGSDFSFEVPLAFDLAPTASSELAGPALAQAAGDRRLRIMLAEDNPDNQLLFCALLKKLPHEILVAENGRVAVEIAAREPIDLIFMDIQMPEMDGLAATRQIREHHRKNGKRVPIYALSAHVMREDIAQSLEAGCDGHLTKPIRRDQLLEIIAAVISNATST